MPNWIKAFVACSLIALLVSQVDWNQVQGMLDQISVDSIIIIQFLVFGTLPISAWKWQLSLRLHGRDFPFFFLLRTICIGFFFNNFLPSGLGGDAYRVLKTVPADNTKSVAISAVFVDRIFGLAAMLGIGAIGAIRNYADYPVARFYLMLVIGGAVTAAALLTFTYFGHLKFISNRLRKYRWFQAVDRIAELLLSSRIDWIYFLVGSVLFQLVSVAVMYILFVALGLSVSPYSCALISASAGLAAILPISVNGIGVVEGSLALTAVALGVPYDQSVVAAILYRIMVLPLSAICGLVFLLDRKSQPLPASRIGNDIIKK